MTDLPDPSDVAIIELEQALAAGDWEPELEPIHTPSNTDSLAARDALSAVLATAPGSWQRADAAADLLAVLGVPVSDLPAPHGWSVVDGDSGATGENL